MHARFFALPLIVLASGACDLTAPAEPTYRPPANPAPAAPPPTPPAEVRAPPPPQAAPPVARGTPQDVSVRPTHPDPTGPDPRGGRFTLAQATEGLAPGAQLIAEIETTLGTFSCTLLSAEAPNTVANFIGLARGTRDFWDPVAGAWVRRPYYNGSVFHRVIPGFMIQGGDILRSGMGGPGYEFADENVNGHNAGGQLCMANHGPNTNGGQFFITEVPRQHLDGSYSIFGRCTPVDLVTRIAAQPRGPRDMPDTPVYIQAVRISRR